MGTRANARSRRVSCALPADFYRAAAAAAQICKCHSRRVRFGVANSARQYNYPLRDIAGPTIATDETPGNRIRIEGRVLDGAGAPVDDAMIELWQADSQGRYPTPATNQSFTGFGRAGTGPDPKKRFIFDTIKPGRVDPRQAPHIGVILFMRGLLVHLYTTQHYRHTRGHHCKTRASKRR